MENKLDLTDVADEQKLSKLTETFQKLKADEQVLIECKGEFNSIMSEFQKQFWGKFEWQPLMITKDAWKGYLSAKAAGPTSIIEVMEGHHRHCDSTYVKAENTLMEGNKETGEELMLSFIWNMEMHFTREEQVLFPAFENKTGMVSGPTQVMRMDHEQIRGVLKEIKESLNAGDYQRIYDLSETMLILIQQHNSKEENILYPMLDQHLAEEAEKLAKDMQLFTI